MEDLVQSLGGPDGLSMPFYLQDTYSDVILRGENSRLFEEIGLNKPTDLKRPLKIWAGSISSGILPFLSMTTYF